MKFILRRNPYATALQLFFELRPFGEVLPLTPPAPSAAPSHVPGWKTDFTCQSLTVPQDWAAGPFMLKPQGTCNVQGYPNPSSASAWSGEDAVSPGVYIPGRIPPYWWTLGRWSRQPGFESVPPAWSPSPVGIPGRPGLSVPNPANLNLPPWLAPPLPGAPIGTPAPVPFPLIPARNARPDPVTGPEVGYHPPGGSRGSSGGMPPLPPDLPPPEETVDIEPEAPPRPGHHIRVPPTRGTREKKGQVSSKQAGIWLKFLDRSLGRFTELDDFVAAIYGSLDWSVRRWRGRDGVWRDRVYKTHERLEQIYQHVDKISLAKMLTNLAIENAIDTGFGGYGKKLGEQVAKQIHGERYKSPKGLQMGGSLTKKQWQKLKQDMQRAYFEGRYDTLTKSVVGDQKTLRHNRYEVWKKDSRGRWVRKSIRRPDTQIPWLRRTGQRLHKRKSGDYSLTPRYWYDAY